MILDFRSNIVLVIMSAVLGTVLAIYLFNNAEGTSVFTAISLGLIYLIITFLQLRRNTFRMAQQLEMVLMVQLNVRDYLKQYERMVLKGSSYSPLWNVTKRQRLANSYVINGQPDQAEAIIEELETDYHEFLKHDAYSAYLLHVIKVLKAYLYESDATLATVVSLNDAPYDQLPDKMKTQLAQNPNSFYSLFKELPSNLSADEKTYTAWMKEKTPFIYSLVQEIFNARLGTHFKSPFLKEEAT